MILSLAYCQTMSIPAYTSPGSRAYSCRLIAGTKHHVFVQGNIIGAPLRGSVYLTRLTVMGIGQLFICTSSDCPSAFVPMVDAEQSIVLMKLLAPVAHC